MATLAESDPHLVGCADSEHQLGTDSAGEFLAAYLCKARDVVLPTATCDQASDSEQQEAWYVCRMALLLAIDALAGAKKRIRKKLGTHPREALDLDAFFKNMANEVDACCNECIGDNRAPSMIPRMRELYQRVCHARRTTA